MGLALFDACVEIGPISDTSWGRVLRVERAGHPLPLAVVEVLAQVLLALVAQLQLHVAHAQ